MTNRRNSSGVVEDIWMNTRTGDDDFDRTDPDGNDAPQDWDEIEEATAILNPDMAGMDRG